MAVFTDELMKLRRRIGDLYAEDATEITTSNVLSVNGTQFKYQELIDTYNEAVNSYLGYMTVAKNKRQWSSLAPGYVVLAQNKGTNPVSKINLDALTPIPFRIIDVMKYTGTTADDVFNEIEPSNWFASISKIDSVRYNQLKYTIMHDGTNWSLFVHPTLTGTVDIIYLKRHTDLTTSITTEYNNVFSPIALQSILIFAEIEAKRSRGTSVQDSPEMRLKTMTELDIMENK